MEQIGMEDPAPKQASKAGGDRPSSGAGETRPLSFPLRLSFPLPRLRRTRSVGVRMEKMNVAFDDLRRLLPVFPPDRTLSKLEILIHAMGYINCLNDVLNDNSLESAAKEEEEEVRLPDAIHVEEEQ
ncbi:hypothetical protein CRUP_033686, partial [Coryphaenoides rupestris]